MSFNKYFQDELVSLRTLGLEFANRNPGLAPFLGTPGRDPDVERLIEGFAFLTGRLRQKLDDELPEITHTLFNLLWPNYLRPVPSCSIIQYSPTEALSKMLAIPRGTKVESTEIEGSRCSFRTIYDVEVAPIRLNRLQFQEKKGQGVLILDFACLQNAISSLDLNKLSFFMTGGAGLAHTLYFLLSKKVKNIHVCVRDEEDSEHVLKTLSADAIEALGFKESEGMLPYPSNTFPGYRLMQEYFCFPEKFSFLELAGLSDLGEWIPERFKDRKNFELQFWFDELPKEAELFKEDNIKLFCTPVVNLFEFDSSPLFLDKRQSEYRIVPDPRKPYHYSVYSVNKVKSWQHNSKVEMEYSHFESFEHELGYKETSSYYRLRVKPSIKDGGTETYISVIHPDSNMSAANETISMELTCTNRLLAEKLVLGDICIPADSSPEHVSFRNITPVTGSYAPPLDGDLLWRLLSNMSLNYISLVDIEALKSVIRAYDFRALHDKQRERQLSKTLSGMVEVDSVTIDRIYRGLPLRGARTILTLNQESFVCEGDMYMFGSILNEFLALYATVNSFHEFYIVEAKRREEYKWPARLGNSIIK